MTRKLCLSTLLAISAFALGCESTSDRPRARDLSQPDPVESGPMGGNPNDLGASYRPPPTGAKPWKDDSEGVSATLIYVTRMGTRNNPKPAAIIFSSDPSNNFFLHKSSPQYTVRRLYRDEMKRLIRQLTKVGFERIPWEEEANYDAKIGPERGLHFYRDKKRTFAIKSQLGLQEKMTFREVEDRLIRITMGR